MDSSIKKSEMKTNGNWEGIDLQLHYPETFNTAWLRYFNCTKVDMLEISNSISFLNNMIKSNEDGNVESLINTRNDASETPQHLSCNSDRSRAPESNSCMDTTQDSLDRQPLIIVIDSSDEDSSPLSEHHLPDSMEICQSSTLICNDAFAENVIPESILDELLPLSDTQSAISPDHLFSEHILESILDEPLPDSDIAHSLPIPFIEEDAISIAPDCSPSSLLSSHEEIQAIKILPAPNPSSLLSNHEEIQAIKIFPGPNLSSLFSNHEEIQAIKNLPGPNPNSLLNNHEEIQDIKILPGSNLGSFVSLLPNQLREDIGKNIIHTIDIYLIIIEKKIDWITGIENEMGVAKIFEIGSELQEVRRHFEDHIMYYNNFFLFLLLEWFCKISLAWKDIETKEKSNRHICKIVHSEVKERYVSFQCESFIHHSYDESFAKEGDVILANFYTDSADNVRLLGYVCSSVSRPYSHRRDDGHEMLKYVNVNKRTDVKKIKIKFHTVFDVTGIILDLPIYFFKLISLRKTLKLNEALKKLRRSPLCEAVLRPWKNNVKSFVLPSYQDVNTTATVADGIVQSLNRLSSQITVVKCSFFMDSIKAIVQIVEKMKKSNIIGKMLICVREEFLSQMGMNLIKTSCNMVILSRKRENLQEKLESRFLDVMVSNLTKDIPQVPDDLAESKVLQDADVLLALTETCFYEHVKTMPSDIAYCIIHDAHTLTEPESLLPLLYGVRHLLLFGDPDKSCDVISKYASSLGYNKSLFHRAYKMS